MSPIYYICEMFRLGSGPTKSRVLSQGGGGGGGYSDIFTNNKRRLGPFFLFFFIFFFFLGGWGGGGVRNMNIIRSMKILWIFLGDHHNIRLVLGVISMHFRVFSI